MGTRARRSEGKHHRTQERYRWYAIQGSDNFAVVDMEELRILMDAVHEGSEPPDRNKDPDRKVKK